MREVGKEAGRLMEAPTVQVRAGRVWDRVLALMKREQVPEYSAGRTGQAHWLYGHRG